MGKYRISKGLLFVGTALFAMASCQGKKSEEMRAPDCAPKKEEPAPCCEEPKKDDCGCPESNETSPTCASEDLPQETHKVEPATEIADIKEAQELPKAEEISSPKEEIVVLEAVTPVEITPTSGE